MKQPVLIILLCLIVLITSVLLIGYRVKAEEKLMTNKKALVAYFSATGTTEKLAGRLAKATGADIFEIKPEKPYTSEDLDWTNSQSRSSVEMRDKNCRPAIDSKLEDISDYEVVFVGFPVWWYREPSIIDTFLESYDFSGKIVVPFATSGGSPIGNSANNMKLLAPKATIPEGKCFSVDTPEDVLKKWADEWL